MNTLFPALDPKRKPEDTYPLRTSFHNKRCSGRVGKNPCDITLVIRTGYIDVSCINNPEFKLTIDLTGPGQPTAYGTLLADHDVVQSKAFSVNNLGAGGLRIDNFRVLSFWLHIPGEYILKEKPKPVAQPAAGGASAVAVRQLKLTEKIDIVPRERAKSEFEIAFNTRPVLPTTGSK